MSDQISFDPGVTRNAGAVLAELAGLAIDGAGPFWGSLEGCGVCWGGDQYGAAFGQGYLPAANDASIGVKERSNQIRQAADQLTITSQHQELAEDAATQAARNI